MDSSKPELVRDLSPWIRIYKDGTIERLNGTQIVPPSLDPTTNIQSKDLVYSPEANLYCRLYLPKSTAPNQKLPLLIYFHGGGFVLETAASPVYHNYLNALAAEANIIVVSVDYRRAPEHPLPIAYDDSWTAVKWVASHVNGDGPEDWFNSHSDFGKLFFAGDSAGGNIAHHMTMRYGQEKLIGTNLKGLVLAHPYFWGTKPIGDEVNESELKKKIDAMWYLVCPTTSGHDDPLINPLFDPTFPNLGCSKVLVLVAEKDLLKFRGWYYYENLKKNGWNGVIEIIETKDEDHVFHLFNPTCENAAALLKTVALFIQQNKD